MDDLPSTLCSMRSKTVRASDISNKFVVDSLYESVGDNADINVDVSYKDPDFFINIDHYSNTDPVIDENEDSESRAEVSQKTEAGEEDENSEGETKPGTVLNRNKY